MRLGFEHRLGSRVWFGSRHLLSVNKLFRAWAMNLPVSGVDLFDCVTGCERSGSPEEISGSFDPNPGEFGFVECSLQGHFISPSCRRNSNVTVMGSCILDD